MIHIKREPFHSSERASQKTHIYELVLVAIRDLPSLKRDHFKRENLVVSKPKQVGQSCQTADGNDKGYRLITYQLHRSTNSPAAQDSPERVSDGRKS